MDEDFDTGNTFKDNIVPLALEYYLGVIEKPDYDEDEADEDSDSDEDKPKAKKGKKGGAGAMNAAAAKGQEECKQQ